MPMEAIFEDGIESGRDAMRSNEILFPSRIIGHVATGRNRRHL